MKIKLIILSLLMLPFLVGVSVAAGLSVDVAVGTSIVDRTPQGTAASFSVNTVQLVGWCRVKGAAEPIEIYHRWQRDGKEIARIKLPVRSSNYRVWSYFSPKGRTGAWTLDVLDWDNNVLATSAFNIQ